jgi:hypothetical protein
MKQNGLREMMDGAASHFSEKHHGQRRRNNFEHLDRLDLAWMLPLSSFLLLFLYLPRLRFCLTSGASSPEWVQPAAEDDSLYLLAFCGLMFCFVFAIIFGLHSNHG